MEGKKGEKKRRREKRREWSVRAAAGSPAKVEAASTYPPRVGRRLHAVLLQLLHLLVLPVQVFFLCMSMSCAAEDRHIKTRTHHTHTHTHKEQK